MGFIIKSTIRAWIGWITLEWLSEQWFSFTSGLMLVMQDLLNFFALYQMGIISVISLIILTYQVIKRS